MIHSIKILLIITILTLLPSCSKKDNPIQPIIDNPLQILLLGEWNYGNREKLVFFPNGIFVDSSFDSYTDSPGIWCLTYIVTGNYSITDSILEFSQYRMIYADTVHYYLLGTSWSPVSIHFANGDLYMSGMPVLEPQDSITNELSGKWKMTLWMATWIKNPVSKFTEGQYIHQYIFNPKDSTYKYSSSFPSNPAFSDGEEIYPYTYSPPFLTTWDWPRIEVIFNNNKMYWLYQGSVRYSKSKIESENARISMRPNQRLLMTSPRNEK
jgi:hypothetical protein